MYLTLLCFLICIFAAIVIGMLSLILVIKWVGEPNECTINETENRWLNLNLAWRMLRTAKGCRGTAWAIGNVFVAYLRYKTKPLPGRVDTSLVFCMVLGAVFIVSPSIIDLLIVIFQGIFGKK